LFSADPAGDASGAWPIPVGLALTLWGWWYAELAGVTPLASRHQQRLPLYLAPPVCLALLLVFRPAALGWGNGVLVALLAFAWVAVLTRLVPFLGLSARDDAVERRNEAAGWAVGGAIVALGLCFVPGFRAASTGNEVFLEGVPATVLLLGLWASLETVTHRSEAITVGRDQASAVRLGFLLLALGLLAGAATADLHPDRVGILSLAPWAFLGYLWLIAALLEPAWRDGGGSLGLLLSGVVPGLSYLAVGFIGFFAGRCRW
jgi:hypothetical protein